MKENNLPERIEKDVIELGKLCFQFARTNRAVYFEDGITPESDTDHTVMLGIIACSFASRFLPQLDIGKVAQLAFIHDFVEVYAGDTPTLKITKEEILNKKERETKAFERIKNEFGSSFPWLIDSIEEYEEVSSKEARFIKTFDKLMPKITHILNNGVAYKELGLDKKEVEEILNKQKDRMLEGYSKDFSEAMELRDKLVKEILDTVFE